MSKGSRPRDGLKSFAASVALVVLFFYVLSHIMLSGPGDHSFFGFWAIFFAFLGTALTIPVWLGLWAALHWRRQRRSAGANPWWILISIGALAIAVVSGYCIVRFVFPEHFRPVHEIWKTTREPARDFTTPWGARMLAVRYSYSMLAGREVWIAETELTRGQYASIIGRNVEGDEELPVSGLSEAQLAELLRRVNDTTAAGTPRDGVFRLPTLLELLGVSGDGPQVRHSCVATLVQARSLPPNALGFRGTTDNAAEAVVNEYASARPFCAALGGVPPHCPSDGREFVESKHCTDKPGAAVFNDPWVGVRLAFSRGTQARDTNVAR